MAASLTLKIITPDRVVLEQEVTQVAATALDGGFAVLPNHVPLMTALATDIVRYSLSNNEEHTVAVMGGVLEVNDNKVTIISDSAEIDTEIDEAIIHQEQERAQAAKLQKQDGLDVYHTETTISRNIARLKAVEHRKRRRHHTPNPIKSPDTTD